MIAKAIDKVKEMAAKMVEQREILIGGKMYIQSLGETFNDRPESPEALKFSTLSALSQYIKSSIDADLCKDIIRIESPTSIWLESEVFSAYRVRHRIAKAVPCLPDPFPFGRFMSGEEFVIGLQSQFVQSEGDWQAVAEACAGIKTDQGFSYKDDGVSQSVATRKGVSLTSVKPLPNPVSLAPYRTFPEIEQPTSKFILRATDRHGEPQLALFEADGGAWKLDAMKKIQMWLANDLSEQKTLILA